MVEAPVNEEIENPMVDDDGPVFQPTLWDTSGMGSFRCVPDYPSRRTQDVRVSQKYL